MIIDPNIREELLRRGEEKESLVERLRSGQGLKPRAFLKNISRRGDTIVSGKKKRITQRVAEVTWRASRRACGTLKI